MNIMSTAGPAGYVERMYRLESKGDNDKTTALENVGKKIGVEPWTVQRIMKGYRKTFSDDFRDRIRTAYLKLCEDQLRKLELEIDIERKALGEHHDLENLADEALALRNKIQARKGTRK